MKNARKNRVMAEVLELESRRLLSTVIIPAGVAVTETQTTDKDSFTVTLNAATNKATKVNLSTKDGTAKAGVDYIPTKKIVTIPAGKTSATFTIPIKGNITYDGNRRFSISYSTSNSAVKLSRKSENVTIKDNETIPSITVSDVVLAEGNRGKKNALVTATLSGPSSLPIAVVYKTANDTAIAGKDYVATKNTLHFAKNQTSSSFKIPIIGNTIPEVDKVVDINFTNSTHSTLPSFSRVVIQDDDHGVVRVPANINNSTVNAGTPANFIVTLNTTSTTKVSIRYNTVAGTATAGVDFKASTGVVTFQPGQTQQTISIPTFIAAGATGTRAFTVVLSAPANATFANDHATGTIVEPAPSNNNGGGNGANQLVTLSVSNPAAPESSAGQQFTLDFEVDLDGPNNNPVTVHFTTVSDLGDPAHATAGVDYTAISGDLTFAPNVTKLIVSVPILPSGIPRLSVKHVVLDLSNPVNASLGNAEGIGAIIGTA
jgi:large repetitive protein